MVCITISGTFPIHLFVPALPGVAHDFHATAAAAQLTITLYIVGLSIGQLIYGPISDRFGRRPVLLLGLALYTVASVAASLSPSLGALIAARRPTGFVQVPVPPLQFLAIPIFDMILFATFVSLALAQRRNSQAHKRLMLLATISLITAAIARWPGLFELGPLAFFGLTDLFVVALAIWDFRSRGRLHPATLFGGLLIVVSQPLRLAVSGTQGWLAFARWATGLLG